MPKKKKSLKRKKFPWAVVIVAVTFLFFMSYLIDLDRDTTSILIDRGSDTTTTTTTIPDEIVDDDVTDSEPIENTYYPPHPNEAWLPQNGYTLYGQWGDEDTAKAVAKNYDDHVVYHNNGWWFVWAKPNPTIEPVIYNYNYESEAFQRLNFGMGITFDVVRA